MPAGPNQPCKTAGHARRKEMNHENNHDHADAGEAPFLKLIGEKWDLAL
jgi:hypothetical protein